jgi:acyl-CoA reductase-like NAD-dependent aldehyde dehydrogenase
MIPFEFSKEHLPTELFINNEFVPSKTGKKLSVFNPKDGSLVSDKISLATEEDVENAVRGAEAALPAWKSTKSTHRRTLMLRLADLIEENTEILSELTRLTLGAPHETWGKHEIAIAVEVGLPRAWADTDLIPGADKNRHSATTPVGLTNLPERPFQRKMASSRLCGTSLWEWLPASSPGTVQLAPSA